MMTDPVSGQMASQAAEAMANQSDPLEGPSEVGSASDFADVMGSPPDSAGAAEGAAEVDATESIDVDTVEALEQIPTEDFVQRLLREESDIQEMMERCLGGADIGQEEMLQMQAVIYSYSQRVELTSKVVDNAVGAMKQVMNTQV